MIHQINERSARTETCHMVSSTHGWHNQESAYKVAFWKVCSKETKTGRTQEVPNSLKLLAFFQFQPHPTPRQERALQLRSNLELHPSDVPVSTSIWTIKSLHRYHSILKNKWTSIMLWLLRECHSPWWQNTHWSIAGLGALLFTRHSL